MPQHTNHCHNIANWKIDSDKAFFLKAHLLLSGLKLAKIGFFIAKVFYFLGLIS